MNIQISKKALEWFEDEMGVKKGEFVRFFARYGGSSPLHQGFSLGVSKEEPIQIGAKAEYNGVVYYVDEKDLWFFDEHDLYVDYSEKLDEPIYQYTLQS
ncbi:MULTISPECIES: HesB/YadR/YfhF family protein [Bacillus]|jgi:uncharacterized protein YneR|uniref:HesB/YadR/YfhF family protein n=1 Tax=Bacillus TaxID=1386 RepID=UPI00065E49E6|nr:HesB/YadR/YfhF family protein [Bacillus smithii]AKP47196.1 hypothetical protein BSM4216_1938 [Bacillus smithii]